MENNLLQLNAKEWLDINLNPENLRLFDIYYELLTEWNSFLNLTSISDYREFLIKHILDSLVPIKCIYRHKNDSINIVDVGTGAGFPGLPLKILDPELRISLIESKKKKAEFLQYVVGALDLKGVRIISERAEIIAQDSTMRETFDVVLARGVSRLDVLSELTLGLLKIGGAGIFHKGPDVESELQDSYQAVRLMGGKLKSPIKYRISNDRFGTLVIVDKITNTPEYLPRNPGIPIKKPLNNRFNTQS